MTRLEDILKQIDKANAKGRSSTLYFDFHPFSQDDIEKLKLYGIRIKKRGPHTQEGYDDPPLYSLDLNWK